MYGCCPIWMIANSFFGQFLGEIRTYLDSHWLFASTRPEEPEPVFNINTAATVVPVLLDKQCKNTAEAM